MNEKKCAYCLEPMNAEARVCPHCTRRQPISRAVKRGLLITAGVLAATVLAFYAFVVVPFNRENELNALHICTLMRASEVPRATIVQEIDERTRSGQDWQSAYRNETIALHCDKMLPTH